MPQLTISDLPPEVYERLKRRAKQNARTVAEESRELLTNLLADDNPPASHIEEKARQLRERTEIYLTEKERKAAVQEGRA